LQLKKLACCEEVWCERCLQLSLRSSRDVRPPTIVDVNVDCAGNGGRRLDGVGLALSRFYTIVLIPPGKMAGQDVFDAESRACFTKDVSCLVLVMAIKKRREHILQKPKITRVPRGYSSHFLSPGMLEFS
jgi:hypothetical protein